MARVEVRIAFQARLESAEPRAREHAARFLHVELRDISDVSLDVDAGPVVCKKSAGGPPADASAPVALIFAVGLTGVNSPAECVEQVRTARKALANAHKLIEPGNWHSMRAALAAEPTRGRDG